MCSSDLAKRLDHDRCAGKNSQKTKMEGHGCVKLVQSKGKEKLCIEKYESVLEGKLVKSKDMEKLLENMNKCWKEN